jgi:hypothetical protein
MTCQAFFEIFLKKFSGQVLDKFVNKCYNKKKYDLFTEVKIMIIRKTAIILIAAVLALAACGENRPASGGSDRGGYANLTRCHAEIADAKTAHNIAAEAYMDAIARGRSTADSIAAGIEAGEDAVTGATVTIEDIDGIIHITSRVGNHDYNFYDGASSCERSNCPAEGTRPVGVGCDGEMADAKYAHATAMMAFVDALSRGMSVEQAGEMGRDAAVSAVGRARVDFNERTDVFIVVVGNHSYDGTHEISCRRDDCPFAR